MRRARLELQTKISGKKEEEKEVKTTEESEDEEEEEEEEQEAKYTKVRHQMKRALLRFQARLNEEAEKEDEDTKEEDEDEEELEGEEEIYLKTLDGSHNRGKLHTSLIAQRARIITLHRQGLSIRAIAARVEVSKNIVVKWIRRWKKTGNLNDLPRKPRSRKTSQDDDERILQLVNVDPFTNAKAIRKELGLNVSAATVRRRLHAAGIVHKAPVRKFDRLTHHHRSTRLNFAHQYLEKGIEFWERAVFTGKKTLNLSSDGQVHMLERDSTRCDGNNIEEDSGTSQVNMWGYTTLYGVGDIVQVDCDLTAEKYLAMLEEFFLPSLAFRKFPFPPGYINYVHDRSPVHTARAVQQWFAGRHDFQVVELPIRCFDMNPLESLWSSVITSWEAKRKKTGEDGKSGIESEIIQETERTVESERTGEETERIGELSDGIRDESATTGEGVMAGDKSEWTGEGKLMDEFLCHMQSHWEALRASPEVVRTYSASMPQRLQAVIDKEGGWTRFIDFSNSCNVPAKTWTSVKIEQEGWEPGAPNISS